MKQPLFKLVVPIPALPRAAKRFVALSVDPGFCVLTVWLFLSAARGALCLAPLCGRWLPQ